MKPILPMAAWGGLSVATESQFVANRKYVQRSESVIRLKVRA